MFGKERVVNKEQLMDVITNKNAILHGWCEENKAILLAELAYTIQNEQKEITCVEIGVFAGKSLYCIVALLDSNLPKNIYGIDPFNSLNCCEGNNDVANDEWWSKIDWIEIIKSAEDIAQKYNCHLIKKTSEAVAPEFNNNSIDLLHQDGNHSEEMSCLDIELWSNKIIKKGYWLMDDTNWPTTQKAQKLIITKGFIEIDVDNGFGKIEGREWKLYQKI